MTTEPTAVAPPAVIEDVPPAYCEAIAQVLCALGPGPLVVRARSLMGLGVTSLMIQDPTPALPLPVLRVLDEGWNLRVTLIPCNQANEPGPLGMVAVLWRPAVAFVDGRHVVTPEGYATIQAAMAMMPAPSVLIAAGPEVWAGWALDTPITDLVQAREVLASFAACLGGEPLDLTADLPLAGPIRNWNQRTVEPIDVLAAAPGRRYSLTDLLRGDDTPS